MKFKESDKLELKKSLSQLDGALKTICAFLNHKGGVIYFGISDKGKVLGQKATDSNLRKISQQITSRIKPQIIPTISEKEIEDKQIIEVIVDRLNDGLYYFDGVPYKRSGTETLAMPPDEVKKRIIDTARFEWGTDICKDASLKDIENEKVREFLNLREKKRNISSKINMSQNKFLTNIKAIQNNKPTNAGILFFAKYTLKHLPNAQIRLARIKGTKVYNLILDKLECNGTLLDMLFQAEEFIKRNIRLMGLRTDRFQRKDRFEYPTYVIG